MTQGLNFRPATGIVHNLVEQFRALKNSNFSGQLEVRTLTPIKTGQLWSFYFYQGHILFAGGGSHPLRRWQRLSSYHGISLAENQKNLLGGAQYSLLCTLFRQVRISREQAISVIQGMVDEILIEMSCGENLSYHQDEEVKYGQGSTPLILVNVLDSLDRLYRSQVVWHEAGLTNISPDQAPTVRQPDQLREEVSPKIYQVLIPLINGNYTLREIALQVNMDVMTLGRSLLPYFKAGMISLEDVPDLPPPSMPITAELPLIACVDDSSQVCQTMERIFVGAGYRYFSVQDPLRGLATLMQRKPDLIFLDLVMPNTNGYEVCSKLRKVAMFRRTPIIILTGNDGIIDRVRAKFTGSSAFIGKPVRPDFVLTVASRHLKKASGK
jgi:chemotaxis family two-component system response regulator PixG